MRTMVNSKTMSETIGNRTVFCLIDIHMFVYLKNVTYTTVMKVFFSQHRFVYSVATKINRSTLTRLLLLVLVLLCVN